MAPSFMASMALSTVACAVIMRISGRSASGVAATSSRMRSRPLPSGIRLSTTSRSKGRSARRRRASRVLVVVTHSWPSARSARPRTLTIFSSSSTSRMEPWAAMSEDRRRRGSGGFAARPGQVDVHGRALPGAALHRDGAAQRLHDVLGDGEAEARARPPGREVGIEDVGQVARLDAGAAVLDDDGDAVPSRATCAERRARCPRRGPPPPAARWSGCSRGRCGSARRRWSPRAGRDRGGARSRAPARRTWRRRPRPCTRR